MLIKEYYGMEECPECHQDIPDDAKAGDKCACGMHTFVDTFAKVTAGFVVQQYKTLPNGTQVCIGQGFVAGSVQYDSQEYGDILDADDFGDEVDCPFLMVQPKPIPTAETDVPEGFENWYQTILDSPEALKNIERIYQNVLDNNTGYPLDLKTWAVKYYKHCT